MTTPSTENRSPINIPFSPSLAKMVWLATISATAITSKVVLENLIWMGYIPYMKRM